MKIFFAVFLFATLASLTPNSASAQTWKAHTPPFADTIGIADIEVVNEKVIWAVGLKYAIDDSLYGYFVPSKTYVALTKDGGATWAVNTVPMGGKPFVANMTALDGITAWVAGLDDNGNSKVLKTIDGGATWANINIPYDPVASWADYIHAFSVAKVAIIGDPREGEFEIYTTSGQVWFRVPGANIPDPLSGEFGFNNVGDAVGNTIWFGTNLGRVYRSKNGGLDWDVHATPAPYITYLAFSDENNGFATTSIFSAASPATQIYRTTDGGETWADITPSNHGFRLAGIACIPKSPYVIMCGTTGGILNENNFKTWLSKDRGSSWLQVSSGEIAGLPTFIDGKTGWAGEAQQLGHKTRLYQYTGSPLVGLLTPTALDAAVTLSPNPASDLLQVRVRRKEVGDFWILLNDLQGNLIQKIDIKGLDCFDRTLNTKDLNPGTYFLTISDTKGSTSKKVLVSH